jgi:hypothetical protein
LGHTAFGVVVACSELGIEAAFLVNIVEVAVDVELDAFLDCELVGSDGPVDLGLFAAVEAIDLSALVSGYS